MKNKITIAFAFLLSIMLLSSACGTKNDTALLSDLNRRIIEIVEENNEIFYSAEDIVVDSIHYGSFSQQGENEALVLCKFLNMPHAGGLDRTAALILSVDSMEMTASTGMSSQSILLFVIREGQWEELPIGITETFDSGCFYYMREDNTLIMTSNTGLAELADSSEILAVYRWDPVTEQFIPAGNEPSSRTCADIWRMPRRVKYPAALQRCKFDAPLLAAGLLTCG